MGSKATVWLIIGSLSLVLACRPADDWGRWQSPEGVIYQWSPAQPQMGDLVQLNLLDRPTAKSSPPHLLDPQGKVVPWQRQEILADQRSSYQSQFRIRQVGAWTEALHGRILWQVKALTDAQSQPKTVDANHLWGRGSP